MDHVNNADRVRARRGSAGPPPRPASAAASRSRVPIVDRPRRRASRVGWSRWRRRRGAGDRRATLGWLVDDQARCLVAFRISRPPAVDPPSRRSAAVTAGAAQSAARCAGPSRPSCPAPRESSVTKRPARVPAPRESSVTKRPSRSASRPRESSVTKPARARISSLTIRRRRDRERRRSFRHGRFTRGGVGGAGGRFRH